jgi:uncharacterized delta-60 repeat protein
MPFRITVEQMKKNYLLFRGVAFLLTIPSLGQDGTLDNQFGDNGSKRLAISDKSTRGTDILVLDDNTILLGVNSEVSSNGATYNRGFYIYKLSANGELDTNFGQNGNIYFPNDNNNPSSFQSFKLVSNNKILIKCAIAGSSKLVRIHLNGTFDSSFGINGIQDITGGLNVDLQSDGKIIVQSQFYDGFNNMYSFSRYHSDGALDLSFGDNGTIVHDVTDFRFDLCASIVIQENDKIIAVGRSYDSGDDYHASISRLNADGLLDSSFGENGTIVTSFDPISDYGEFNDVKLFSNKILAAGNMYYSGGTGGFSSVNPALIKFNMNGSLDATFGDHGKVVLETIFDANDYLRTLYVQPNGKILIGGGASFPFPLHKTYFFVTKLNFDGSIDTTFGNSGIFITDFENPEATSSYVTDLALHENDRILAYGVTKDFNDEFRNAIICRIKNEFLSVSELSITNEISIWPNPTNDFVRISSGEAILKTEIYNSIGQLIELNDYTTGIHEIELNFELLQNGLYEILVFNSDQKSYTKKIMKR